ncbi:MAG: DUF4011 domain-containing protein [Clostridia bacterium]|nr:DUF4011 domain-containing protein [Clostridia bacterium]
MNAEKLNKWAELLLDTGKRNNLIHFKDAKQSTVEILSPDFVTLFNRAEHSAIFEVYDPKLEDEEEEFYYFEEELGVNRYEKRIPKEDYLSAYERKLKRQQILLYNIDNKPISALKNISKKARSAMEETGVNIAYIAFGFIHWTENGNSQYMRAPILLAPVTIENESSVDPFYVKVTDDELIVNPTFAFKLQNEYGLKLPEFDEEEGIVAYFIKIQDLISKLKWSVSSECKIGIFSFLKINMYKDLKDNAPTIAQNANIRALLGEADFGDVEGGQDSVESDLHNVVDADSSQNEAIEMALRGKSFVLQGPPGTGKSQTITNIIAECLAGGKKVLFVSEKLAALNVVYEKLKNAGLDEFCLELHSHKANKRQVIDELCHTLKLQKSGVSRQAEKELKAKAEAQKKLDGYAVELHKVRPIINKTLYGLYEEVSACRFAPNTELIIPDIQNKGEEYIEKAESVLGRYVDYIPSIGYEYRHNVWYGYVKEDCSYQAVMQVKDDLQAVATLCRCLQEISEKTSEKYGISVNTLALAHTFEKFFQLVKESDFITPALLLASKTDKALGVVKQMQTIAAEILDKKRVLEATFDEDIYRLDGQTLFKKLTRQFNGFFSRVFNGEYRRLISDIKLCKKDGKKPKYKEAVEAVDMLCVYQQKLKKFNELEARIQGTLGRGYSGVNTDFALCISELRALSEILATGVSFKRLSGLNKDEFVEQQPVFADLAACYKKAFLDYGEAELRIYACFDLKEYDLPNTHLSVLLEKFEGCYDSVDKLDHWCGFVALLQKLKGIGLRRFVDYAIKKKIDASQIVSAYKKAFYTQWIDAVLHETPALLEFARVPHDEAVKRFKEKDRLHFEINKAKIKAELSAQRPPLDMVAQGSSIAILLREGEKKRKQKGIRLLLSEIGELVQTLKPCFLMSPLSVSTYLAADMPFDVVIFDEASQIFPQDAVEAIYRGKQLIVVGDSKQMPPSNFFNASVESDLEDETEDITDFESILDLCSTTFPQRRLKWHYRSRFEQLISFSNKNFYDNDLVTFPSSKTDKEGIGVDYIHVNGVFDRKTKTNRAEAEKIVDLVFAHIEKYPERSLGVVAFSISQQNLIDKLISKRRKQDPSKEAFFKFDKVEPFFVKNLETVQGDERDTIIFSIAYAKDLHGKLLLNFGPINREGGERRLNVAVTRAKCNVQVVSSMHYTDIDLSGSKSVGARLLREYLQYAENGTNVCEKTVEINPFEEFDSEFETEVYDFLRENGYSVDMQVGCSALKIDLAVKSPDSADYVLAIECDGATYHSSKTARDRDRLRQEVLERMGWKFYRIWSTDWFRNKRVEKERLLTVVKEALENVPKEDGKTSSKVSFEEMLAEKHFAFPKYKMANEEELGRKMKGDIARIICAMLETEAPLSEEWLLKRIVFLFGGREKVTNVVRDEYETAIGICQTRGVIRRNGFLYLSNREVPMLRVPMDGTTPRDVKYIAIEELANGLKELLKQNVTAEKSGLFKLLAEQLGFARMGDAICERLEKALRSLEKDVAADKETLSLK